MKWTIDPASTNATRRVETKIVFGEQVERISKYGLHSHSIFGRNAIGTYARHRWAVINYKCLGLSFTDWAGVKEFLGDPDSVVRVKSGGSYY